MTIKVAKTVNVAVDGVVTFVLKILGAFGACWGGFSAASIAYREFGGGPEDVDFMNNSIYAKTALCVSLSAATLSAYVIARDKLNAHYAKQDTDEISVAVPLCYSFDSSKKEQDDLEGAVIEMSTGFSRRCVEGDMQVICKRK